MHFLSACADIAQAAVNDSHQTLTWAENGNIQQQKSGCKSGADFNLTKSHQATGQTR
jgi:hypothetical protein